MSISSNFPTLRPSLLLDFANSGRLDPRVTFTRASTATYFDETGVLRSAANDTPRFDYDPSTLAARGFLIEEARTNLFPASNDFANATYWTVSGTAVATAGAGTGPDGLNSAVNLAGATDTTLGGNNIEESISVTASIAYEFSVFVKSNGGTTVTLRLRDSTGGSSSSTAFPVTSTWTRISFNRTMAVGATSVRCIIGLTNGDIFIYGAQLEAGAFPTSYIPTTTTALTRSADVASVNTLSPWYNATEGTLYSEAVIFNPSSAFSRVASIENSSYTSSLQTARNLADSRGFGDGVSINQGTGTFPINTVIKQALAGKVNDFALSTNGSAVAVDTTTNPLPTNVIAMGLGSSIQPSSYINGWLRRVTYYPRRLSNAELVSITS